MVILQNGIQGSAAAVIADCGTSVLPLRNYDMTSTERAANPVSVKSWVD